ncbi:MAG: DUF1304 domain-containing protein [Anaerolineae bacterium]|nr:DUF1304 domain-containing protein [Anaerolineae bacterium]
MDTISKILVALVAIEHVYILYMEMFLWTTPSVRKNFGTTETFANESKALAANQGLYNGFLAAGLVWGVINPTPAFGHQIQIFFLVCVIIAAIYGSITAKRSILYVQGGPALIALIVVLVAGG